MNSKCEISHHSMVLYFHHQLKEGRKEGREGGREEGREGGRQGGREGQ